MTPDVCDAILRAIRLGLHADRAAAASGIKPSTMRAHKQRHPEFASAVKEAEAVAERGFLSRLLQHTDKQWTACAWMLERRWPERWAKRDRVEVSTTGEAQQLLQNLQAMKSRTQGDAS